MYFIDYNLSLQNDIFGDNFAIKIGFTKYLKESCRYWSE